MLNFRKLKQDYSPNILKDGKSIFEQGAVTFAKIVQLSPKKIVSVFKVIGAYEHTYTPEIEIDRRESMIADCNCDCSYPHDCQHLAASLYFLEEHMDALVVSFSKENKVEAKTEKEKAHLEKVIKKAVSKEEEKQEKKHDKELLEEYAIAAEVLGSSPFFLKEEKTASDKAELCVILLPKAPALKGRHILHEVQLALRLPYRSKPLHIGDPWTFLEAIRFEEPLYIGTKKFFFTLESFAEDERRLLLALLLQAKSTEGKEEKASRNLLIDEEHLGSLLAEHFEKTRLSTRSLYDMKERAAPGLFYSSVEEPLFFSNIPAKISISLDYITSPAPKILLSPKILVDKDTEALVDEVTMFPSRLPGIIHKGTYFRFSSNITRRHLSDIDKLMAAAIPDPLFGTLVENALPELLRYAKVKHLDIAKRMVTLPFAGPLQAECLLEYLEGELEAKLFFIYGSLKIPASTNLVTPEMLRSFISKEGILARNLTEEQAIVEDLFQGFLFDQKTGSYVAKTEKKIVEFMTEVVPRNQHRVTFQCPENLLDQFIYDNTHFSMKLSHTSRVDVYELELKVDGHLKGVTLDVLWECLSSRRTYLELPSQKKRAGDAKKQAKILVLDLDRLHPVVRIFDEMGIERLENHTELKPLWNLASIEPSLFEGLPIEFSMTEKLLEIQKQMLGEDSEDATEIPKEIRADLRKYQVEGISWLEKLRKMHLNGILADDMGLGKTLQAIAAITRYQKDHESSRSIVVCPTSLLYNWKEEITKFNPWLKVLVVDGTPQQRKKLIGGSFRYDVVVTSYSLLQKDIEVYKDIPFGYVILDEAQHIKNRSTRNARSVKMIQGEHRLILTGTPIENSLDEIWSLFDFLMPGLLSSYERFLEKYVKSRKDPGDIEILKKKVSPFILRRMKQDVLSELPPVSEIVYHCTLSPAQKELYQSYAASAREELSELVRKEGFDKLHIHVLATLTRLKQICCHPAIFAKEFPESGDSAKYDMLLELIQNLISGGHKAVVFSQYTRMLAIIRQDLEQLGIRFEYLDGATKQRMQAVKRFNEDPTIPIFLVSLKAGGTGLNFVGADTVIHYDMWWNPAVENQATDRVHRMGQQRSVSSYKLVTLNTIEEKIIQMQNSKRHLVKKVISSDEDAIAKLTWEEVLELLQT